MSHYQPQQPWLPCSEVLLAWDDTFHQLMLEDRLRMARYHAAIMQTVRPGDVVVDVGTGTGILSQWALEAGAARVYGIDLDAAILDRACTRLGGAGLADRFIPINQLSFEVVLPEAADLLLSEIMGNMADNEDMQPILADAAQRFLKPGGRSLPHAVSSWLVPVAATEAHERVGHRDVATLGPAYNLAELFLERGISSPFNFYYDCIVPRATYLTAPQPLVTLAHPWIQTPVYSVDLTFQLSRAGMFTGFKAFFVADLNDDVVLDISADNIDEGCTSDSWKHAFLPIETPQLVMPGDRLRLRFERFYPEDSSGRRKPFRQVYRWRGELHRGGQIIARFDQCMDEDLLADPCE